MGGAIKWVECLANILDSVFAVIFFWSLLGLTKKLKKWLCNLIMICCVIVNVILQNIFPDSPQNICAYLIFSIVFVMICTNGRMSSEWLSIAIWNIILMFASIVYATAYSYFKSNVQGDIWDMSAVSRVHYLIGQKLLLSVFMLLAIVLLKKLRLKSAMPIMNIVVFIISVLIGIILDMMLDYEYLDNKGKVAIEIAMIGILSINVFVYVATYQWNKNQKLLLENQLLRMSQEEQRESMERMMQLQEKNRILRHDLRHYFTVFQELLSAGKTEEAGNYVEEVLSTKFQPEGIYMTGDEILDAVLNHCDSMCRQKGISFHAEVSAHLPQGQMEFAIALLNLLENAIEAEEQEKEKKIELQIYESAGLHLVTVRNRIEKSVLKDNPHLHTRKADASIHGLGRKSVKKIIQDMDGSFYEEEKNGYFISNIVI